VPLIGQWVSRNRAAYRYLPASIAAFPQNAELAAILVKNGFTAVSCQKLTLGICTMYLGSKSCVL
jgi:demethylmenaquinone methyltransferase/2-methoxy-6-polyprenyl-1,4-benzoquinol methylase